MNDKHIPPQDSAQWRKRLLLPAYQVKDAAQYAQITTQTVLNWQRKGKEVGSAIAARQPRVSLSYLQLQELAIVSAMRQSGIPLKKIRLAREYLATHFKLEFPFADHRVKSDGQDILMQLDELGGDVKLLVANRGGQFVWREIIGARFNEFDYELELAVRWHIRGRDSGVVIDPRLSFGAPSIRGVPTWAVKGRYVAGESLDEIAKDFLIRSSDVRKALAFEGVTLH